MSDRSTSLQASGRPAGQTSLRMVDSQSLYNRMNELYEAISMRAFQLFEDGGGQFGRDLDDWFRAEAELLHPAHMSISETDDEVTVKTEVPGFHPEELKVSLEPGRLIISGKRQSGEEQGGEQKESPKTVYEERCCSEMFRVIDLPTEVDASKTTATLTNGILELHMPKVAGAGSQQIQVKAAAGGA